MGAVAFVIEEDGTIRNIFAARMKLEDRGKEMFCAGRIEEDGTICGTQVSFVEPTERKRGYFGAFSKNHPHRKGCQFDEKRKEITVEMLDRSGKGKTTEDVFSRLNKDKPKKPRPPKGDSHPPEGEIEPDTTEEEYEEEGRKIRSKERPPQTVQELVMILQSLDTKDYYADKLVFDQILDERTVAAYRRMPIPEGTPFVITVRKTLPYPYVQNLENNQWVLVDYWTKSPNSYTPLVFILTVTAAAKKKLYNLCQRDPVVKIQVYVKLKKHPTLPNTYISELVKAHMICASFDVD